MFQTLSPTLPIYMCTLCIMFAEFGPYYISSHIIYLHNKVSWISVKEPKLITKQCFINEHICSYTHPVQQYLVITMVGSTLRTHSHTSLIIQPECAKLSLQSYLYVYITFAEFGPDIFTLKHVGY